MTTKLFVPSMLCLLLAVPSTHAGSPGAAGAQAAKASKAPAIEAPELLDPEVAFRFSAKLLDAKTLEVRYAIADGYYMYKDKFKFSAAAPAALGKASIPKGDVKDDPNFGRVETYRSGVAVKLPVAGLPQDGKLSVTVISQGCADVGVCYPPLTSKATLDLKGSSSETPSAAKPLSSILNKP
jgi:thiol:disulfide interchange protein DsbD